MKGIRAIEGRKRGEKRSNCLLQAIAPFLTMISTGSYLYGSSKFILPNNGLKIEIDKSLNTLNKNKKKDRNQTVSIQVSLLCWSRSKPSEDSLIPLPHPSLYTNHTI